MKSVILAAVLAIGLAHTVSARAEDFVQQANEVVREGAFAPVDMRHHIEGTLRIEKRASNLYLILDQGFVVSQGPDLRVVFRDSTKANPMEIVAPLQQFQGLQEYILPLTEQALAGFDQVVIYCARFHVDFGIASIQ